MKSSTRSGCYSRMVRQRTCPSPQVQGPPPFSYSTRLTHALHALLTRIALSEPDVNIPKVLSAQVFVDWIKEVELDQRTFIAAIHVQVIQRHHSRWSVDGPLCARLPTA
jgi:hypothetical protein